MNIGLMNPLCPARPRQPQARLKPAAPTRLVLLPLPLLLCTLLLQGCAQKPVSGTGGVASAGPAAPASRPPPPPSTAPGPAAAAPGGTVAAAAHPLVTERQWLQSWFTGTPVQISQRGDGPVDLLVPREFCFDAGRTQVKPALGAVLDKLAQSLRRAPQLRLQSLTAPGDPVPQAGAKGTATLALQRAAQVRGYLVARGVPASQLTVAGSSSADAVQLRLELPAP